MFSYKPNRYLFYSLLSRLTLCIQLVSRCSRTLLSLSQLLTLTMTTMTYAGKYQDDYNRLMNLVPSCKGKKGKGRTTRSKVSRPFSFISFVADYNSD